MKISAVDEAIEACREHLEEKNWSETMIESYIVRHLVVVIFIAFEKEIVRIFTTYACRNIGFASESFVRSCVGKAVRSIKTSEIAGLLARCGPKYKQMFNRDKDEEIESRFNNIVINRNLAVHEDNINLTFSELVESYEKGHKMLDLIEEILAQKFN